MGAVLGRFSAHPEVIRVSGGRAWPPLGFGSAIWISKEIQNSSLYKLPSFLDGRSFSWCERGGV